MADRFDPERPHPDTPPPEDLRIVADILALVLDEQTGQATNALQSLRNRAKRNRLTGGALKNLFVSLASDSQRTGHKGRIERMESEHQALTHEMNRANARIRVLQSQLAQSQRDTHGLLTEAAVARTQQGWRYAAIGVALLVGILLGAAGSAIEHSLTAPPVCDRASYLH